MKKVIFGITLILLLLLSGCSEKHETPDFSDYYLVGFDYGGISWGSVTDCVHVSVIVCTDHTVGFYLPPVGNNLHYVDYELKDTITLTDEQYANIESLVDRETLSETEVVADLGCDGKSFYLYFYDDDLNIVGKYGAYEPVTNDPFWDIYREVRSNVPLQRASELRNEWIDDYNYMMTIGDLPVTLNENERPICGLHPEVIRTHELSDRVYQVLIGYVDQPDNAYTVSRECFFYFGPDEEIRTFDVCFPPVDEEDADRHVYENTSDKDSSFVAVLDDVNFDGYDDILICLGEKNSHIYWCAYLYDDGNYVYSRSFEQIADYVINSYVGVVESDLYYLGTSRKQIFVYDEETKEYLDYYEMIKPACNAYADYLGDSMEGMHFSLEYLNDDFIPELVYGNDECTYILSYVDTEVVRDGFPVIEDMYFLTEESIVFASIPGEEEYSFNTYRLKEDGMLEFLCSVSAQEDRSRKYMIASDEVTESEYYTYYKELLSGKKPEIWVDGLGFINAYNCTTDNIALLREADINTNFMLTEEEWEEYERFRWLEPLAKPEP